MDFWWILHGFLMDFSILNLQFFKIFKIAPKMPPNHPKSTPKPSQIRPKIFDFSWFFWIFLTLGTNPGVPWRPKADPGLITGHLSCRRAICAVVGLSGASGASSQPQFEAVWAPQDLPGPQKCQKCVKKTGWPSFLDTSFFPYKIVQLSPVQVQEHSHKTQPTR